MLRAGWMRATLAAVSVLLLAGGALAQPPAADESRPSQPTQVPAPPTGQTAPPPATEGEEQRPLVPAPETATEPQRVPEEIGRTRTPTFIGPDLFNPPAHQGFINITPSLTLSGEYNDNLFLSSRNRQSDVIFGFTPGVTVTMQRAGFRLLAGYNTTGQVFLEESELNDFGKQHQLIADLYYQISPRLSFSVADSFVAGPDSNALSSSGVSAGRQDSLRNTLTPRLRWQATPTTAIGFFASHTIVRFTDDDTNDSDTYRVGAGMERRLTPRLGGTLNGSVAYFDFNDSPSAWTYTANVGIAYDVTPTLRATLSGGPTLIERDGETTVTPSLAAGLFKTFKFGVLGVGYDRSVTAETVGLSDRQAFFASLTVPTLVRGLQLGFTPYYAIVDTDVAAGTDETIKVLTLSLRATYQIARNISVIGSYTFYQQSTDVRPPPGDIDQNRVFFGLQYAYPITVY